MVSAASRSLGQRSRRSIRRPIGAIGHECVRARGRRRPSHLLRLFPRTGRLLGHVPVARTAHPQGGVTRPASGGAASTSTTGPGGNAWLSLTQPGGGRDLASPEKQASATLLIIRL